MKKLLLLLAITSFVSCSTEEIQTEGFIPQRYVGDWRLSNSNKIAKIRVNKLETENILQTQGTVTADNGTTLFKASFENNEKVMLLLNIGNPDTELDDIVGISYYKDSELIINGYYVRD